MSETVNPPPSAKRWVKVLGQEAAVELFLALGGCNINLAYKVRSSRLAEIVGADRAEALGQHFSAGTIRVPIPKEWIAQVKVAGGMSVQEVARLLHVDRVTVQRYIRAIPRPPPVKDGRQAELF